MALPLVVSNRSVELNPTPNADTAFPKPITSFSSGVHSAENAGAGRCFFKIK